jgi:lipopolysaccharide transport system permease protein
VNFPRTTLPVTLLLSATINFGIVFGIFLLFLIFSGRYPGSAIISFVPLLAIQQAFAIGMGMVLGAINVFFRDVGHFLNIVMQFWFWLTPIVYPLNILPEKVRRILELNPMTKLIIAYQEIILYGKWPDWVQFRFHIMGALLSLIVGYSVFKGLSDDIVDEL